MMLNNPYPCISQFDRDNGDASRTPEEYLELACQHSPIIKKTIKEHGKLSLSQYLRHFTPNGNTYYQNLDDFRTDIEKYKVD